MLEFIAKRQELMGTPRRGDYIKIELSDNSGAKEWVWVAVDDVDETRELVFGRLDNQPIANTDIELGTELVVKFDKILEHRSFRETH